MDDLHALLNNARDTKVTYDDDTRRREEAARYREEETERQEKGLSNRCRSPKCGALPIL